MSEFPPIKPEQIHGRSLESWQQYLVDDPAPDNRYGETREQCAWWAIAALTVHRQLERERVISDDDTARHFMGAIIDDKPGLQKYVIDNLALVPREIAENLLIRGGDDA